MPLTSVMRMSQCHPSSGILFFSLSTIAYFANDQEMYETASDGEQSSKQRTRFTVAYMYYTTMNSVD